MYNGKANWHEIAKVKNAVAIPVIANGDIRNVEDAKLALNFSGADGVMIGRACYGKPWLIAQISSQLNGKKLVETPSLLEQKNIVLEHFTQMIEHYGAQVGISLAKKHIGWYSSGLAGSADFRAKINMSGSYSESQKNSENYFLEASEEIKNSIVDFYEKQFECLNN
jgi:tRNA-dihydrouridine synthase B